MEATLRKTGVLVSKDFKDMIKNPTMLICSLMPIAFIALYSQILGQGSAEEQDVVRQSFLTLAFCMSAGMVGSMTVLTAIAEEKEKYTLRTLMLANVSAGQILASRGFVAVVTIALVDIVCFFVLEAPVNQLAAFLVIGLLGSIPVVVIALLLGIAARDQMTAGLYSLPIVLIAFIPGFTGFNETINAIAPFSPTGGAGELLGLAMHGNLFTVEAAQPLVVTLAWIAASAIAFAFIYKRLSRDN